MATLIGNLRLKSEISTTDILAGGSAASVVLATVYNWGFFSPVSGGFVSWLNVQDILIGAVITAIPTGTAVALGMTIPEFFRGKRTDAFGGLVAALIGPSADLSKWQNRKAGVTLSSIALVLSIAFLAWILLLPEFLSSAQYGLFALTMMFWCFAALTLTAKRHVVLVFIAMTVCGIPYFIGRGEYYRAINDMTASNSTVRLTDGTEARGKIVRSTSAYLFLFDGDYTLVWPNSQIVSITTPISRGLLNG